MCGKCASAVTMADCELPEKRFGLFRSMVWRELGMDARALRNHPRGETQALSVLEGDAVPALL